MTDLIGDDGGAVLLPVVEDVVVSQGLLGVARVDAVGDLFQEVVLDVDMEIMGEADPLDLGSVDVAAPLINRLLVVWNC